MANVRGFGAAGDGVADDTNAIEHAIAQGDHVLEFPPGNYRITRTIEIDLTHPRYFAILGMEGTARILMAGPGPAFRLVGTHQGTANPRTVQPKVWQSERFPCIRGIEILGQHPQADGIELVRTMQATIAQTQIRNVGVGIRLTERNRNFLLTGCHIYDNREVGVLFDDCNIHQAIISANHISYNKHSGIKSRGGDLHNLQITGNDIEYNYDPEQEGAADIFFDAREGMASEITIASNTIQAIAASKGANIRIWGSSEATLPSACLIAITGNVIGSQDASVELSFADRVTITGNTIYDGRRIGIEASDCQHVVVSANTFAWRIGSESVDGIRFTRCSASLLNGLILDSSRLGDASAGGTIELHDCVETAITGCQILRPAYRGIYLKGCQACRVSDNSVLTGGDESTMLAAIYCDGRTNVVQNNVVHAGTQAAVQVPDLPEMEAKNTVLTANG